MFSSYNNWNGGSPRDSEIEIHKMKTQEMRNDTHHYYEPEVPDFDKNKNDYYDQFEKKQGQFPWRRFFARSLDLTIYSTIFETIAALGFRINILETGFIYNVISILLTLVFMIFVEAFLLSRFGTTPGKCIFGIKVTTKDGHNITFIEGLERTFGVIRYGLGFQIPFYDLYRQYKSYQDCRDGWQLEWDRDFQITLQDKKKLRIVLFLAVNAILILLSLGVYQLSTLSVHRGELTVEEFCENYNAYARFFKFESDILLPDGTWQLKTETDSYTIDLYEYDNPDFEFLVEDGILKGVGFEIHKTNEDKNNPYVHSDYGKEILLATLSYLRAQDNYNPCHDKSTSLIEDMLENLDKDHSFRAYDVDVNYNIDVTGYYSTGFGYWPEEGKDCSIRISFKIQKVE